MFVKNFMKNREIQLKIESLIYLIDNKNSETISIEDSLDTLRIFIKYLLFSLEAVERENKILRNK